MATQAVNIHGNFKIIDNATKVLSKIGKGFQPLGRQLQVVAKRASAVTSSVGKIITPLTVVTGIAGRSFVQGISNAREYANATGDLADRLGVSAKFLQEQHYVAKLNAGSAEEMTSAIETLSRGYGALQAGTGKLYSGLQKISPALLKQVKAAKSSEEAFDIMVKALRKVEDPAKRVYLSQLAFGNGAKSMINVAQNSEEALAALRQEAHDLGAVMDDSTIKGAQDMGEAMDKLTTSVGGVFNQLASKLIPILTPFIQRITEWIKVNKELIGTKIEQFAKQFAEVLSKIDLEAILNGLANFGSLCLNVTQVLAGLNKWVLILGVAIGTGLLGNLARFALSLGKLFFMIPGVSTLLSKLGTGIMSLGARMVPLLISGLASLGAAIKAVSLAFLASPIGWIVAGIAAVIAIFALLWNKCEGFRNFWIGLWDGIKTAAGVAWDFLTGAFEGIMHPIDTLMAKFDGFRSFWETTWDLISGIGKGAIDFIADTIGAIMHPIDTLMKKFETLKSIGGWFADKLGFGNDDEGKEETPESQTEPTPPIQAQDVIPQQIQNVYSPVQAQTQKSHSEVVVKFDNMPKGAEVEQTSSSGPTDLGLEYGYAMGGA